MIYIGRANTIPINPNKLPPKPTVKITTTGLMLFVLPYIFGDIKYPSKFGNIKHIIKDKKGIEHV